MVCKSIKNSPRIQTNSTNSATNASTCGGILEKVSNIGTEVTEKFFEVTPMKTEKEVLLLNYVTLTPFNFRKKKHQE